MEDKKDENRVPGAALILPRGKEIILQAEEKDYKRGLLVELLNSGGYRIKYWYGEDVKVYPVEVEVDGESIKEDAKVIDILFHPELKEDKQSLKESITESLRNWFKKEDWVRIDSSGNIAGPCGTSKNKKNPDRCLPLAKAKRLSKKQLAATAKKKKRQGKSRQFVSNTKAARAK